MDYTIGCDPELFIRDGSGRWISAHNCVKGTKDRPFMVDKGATQVDGVAAEFNINPCHTVDEFVDHIQSVMNTLNIQIKSEYDVRMLVAEPVAWFDQVYFKSLPDETKTLGCLPDWSAYTGKKNKPPTTVQTFRTGSGHIHVGYYGPENYEEDVHNRVQQLDFTLFINSLLWDKDNKRRELYGMPGAFRYKPYGFEYRVLSNKWVGDENLQRWVFNTTKRAMELYDDGVILYSGMPPQTEYSRQELLWYHSSMVEIHNFEPLPEKYVS